jgi:drug/metabolite transporter (DMT)-like permease
VIASGLSGYFLYQMMFILGLDRTSAVASSVLVATHPIFSVLFAWMLWRDRPARHEIAGVVVAFIGVAVFLQVWRSLGDARLGDLLSLGAAASFGFYGVITRPLTARYPSKELMAYTLAVGGLLTALTGIPAMVHQNWGAVSAESWLILVYAIVGPVYVAYALWNWAIRKRGIPRTVVYGFLTPVVRVGAGRGLPRRADHAGGRRGSRARAGGPRAHPDRLVLARSPLVSLRPRMEDG